MRTFFWSIVCFLLALFTTTSNALKISISSSTTVGAATSISWERGLLDPGTFTLQVFRRPNSCTTQRVVVQSTQRSGRVDLAFPSQGDFFVKAFPGQPDNILSLLTNLLPIASTGTITVTPSPDPPSSPTTTNPQAPDNTPTSEPSNPEITTTTSADNGSPSDSPEESGTSASPSDGTSPESSSSVSPSEGLNNGDGSQGEGGEHQQGGNSPDGVGNAQYSGTGKWGTGAWPSASGYYGPNGPNDHPSGGDPAFNGFTKTKLPIILGIIIPLVVFLAIIVFVCIRRRRRRKDTSAFYHDTMVQKRGFGFGIVSRSRAKAKSWQGRDSRSSAAPSSLFRNSSPEFSTLPPSFGSDCASTAPDLDLTDTEEGHAGPVRYSTQSYATTDSRLSTVPSVTTGESIPTLSKADFVFISQVPGPSILSPR